MGGKEGTKKGHIIIFRARTARAYYNYLQGGKRTCGTWEQGAKGRGTECGQRKNSASKRKKRWFTEEKAMV